MSSPRLCPTCHAPWRAAASCARCGTDLLPLMRLALRAHALRDEVRRALISQSGRGQALALARRAHRLEATHQSAALLALSACAAGELGQALAAIHEAERLADPT